MSGRIPRGLLLPAWLCLLAGCAKPPPPPAPPMPQPSVQRQPPVPRPEAYPNLCADPAREAVLVAYLQAWRLHETPDAFAHNRSALLKTYAAAYADLQRAKDDREYDRRLRVAWDLCGVLHSTGLSPADVKAAIGWREPAPPPGSGAEASLTDAAQRPVRTHLEGLPGLCRKLLRAVPATDLGEASFADYVAAHAREAYLTAELSQWSPGMPLEVCGSSEPLTRTLILIPASYIDLSPKPEWSIAAVAVHETAHVEWFHRPEAGREPRLLLVPPNERNAFIAMARFLEGLLRVKDPAVQDYVGRNANAIREQLREARTNVRRANERLDLPPGDFAEHLDVWEE